MSLTLTHTLPLKLLPVKASPLFFPLSSLPICLFFPPTFCVYWLTLPLPLPPTGLRLPPTPVVPPHVSVIGTAPPQPQTPPQSMPNTASAESANLVATPTYAPAASGEVKPQASSTPVVSLAGESPTSPPISLSLLIFTHQFFRNYRVRSGSTHHSFQPCQSPCSPPTTRSRPPATGSCSDALREEGAEEREKQ